MEEKTGKNIFIIGGSAREYTLAKKLIALDEVSVVFVAPGNDAMKEFCTVIDIRETNTQELLEFAHENSIDLTIASSEIAIKNDIANLFQSHNQMIFAPTEASASICTNKSIGKKFMYKNRIPCPKFAIFDKPSMAIDYAKNSNMPIVIKTDEHQEKGVLVCNSFSIAKNCIEDFFSSGEKKVIIEDYILGHGFSFYVISDGYHALPLGSVATYKYELEGDGGLITDGTGAYTPDYRISKQTERDILRQIIFPTINSLARQHTPYIGVLGVDLIINDERFYAIEFNSFLKDPDSQAILAILNENIYHLFQACVVGSFADDYNQIEFSDKSAVSCVLWKKKALLSHQKTPEHPPETVIYGLDDLEEETQVAHFNTKKNAYLEYEAPGGRTLVLTRTARILSKAVKDLYEETSVIKFDGMKYRRDITKF